jgi:hypothetical protein
MGASPFVLSAVEQMTIAKILRDFPAAAETLEMALQPILDRLARGCRGFLQSDVEVDYVLTGLADRIAARSLTELQEGDDAAVLQAFAMDLLTRHVLARMRAPFAAGVLRGCRNRPGEATDRSASESPSA